MKTKNYTTKQSIKRLETVIPQLYVKVLQLDQAIGEIQRLIDIKTLRSEEEEE